jgi:hypothetical protein
VRKGCLAPGQPERSKRATRRESSLLERPPPQHRRAALTMPVLVLSGRVARAGRAAPMVRPKGLPADSLPQR